MVIALRILIVAALQTAALAYMIVDRQATLNSAHVVTLKMAPVDPRDIFRGDYVILNYEISTLELDKLQGEDAFGYGDKVFVTLVRNGDTWNATAIARKPVPAPGGVAIAGTVDSFTSREAPAGADPNAPPPLKSVTITYGIESYFVPEGTGHVIEDERRKGELSVDVAIDDAGRAAIKALRRNGQVFYVEGFF